MPAAQTAHLSAPASKASYKRLTAADHAVILRLHAQDITQADIAKRLGCSQQAVSQWLAQVVDTTDAAKLYFRGQALHMAQSVVKKGKPSDHVAALKGLSVLEEKQQQGLVVQVGAGARVQINLGLSPSTPQGPSESLEIANE